MLDRLSCPARTRVITLLRVKWVGAEFFERAEIGSLAIDAGPLDCFLLDDGVVIRPKQQLPEGLASERFTASRSTSTTKRNRSKVMRVTKTTFAAVLTMGVVIGQVERAEAQPGTLVAVVP